MKTRQKFLDIVCVLIIGLVCFFFAGGFAWDLAKDLFGRPFDFVECVLGLFIFVSLLSALATCICRLIRIHLNPSKAEKSVAVVYLCLAILGIYPLIIVSLFATMTFSSGDSQWLMTRNLVSVLSMDLSIIWLAVLSVKLILKGNNDYF